MYQTIKKRKRYPTDWLLMLGVSISLVLGLLIVLAVIVGSAKRAHGQALPLPKQGSCPSGYSSSGGYCQPSATERRVCVAKVGQCPSNFFQSGNYCCKI